MGSEVRVTVRYLLPSLDVDRMTSADEVLDYLAAREGGRRVSSGVMVDAQVRECQYEFPGPPARFLAEVHGQGMKTEEMS